MSDKRIELETLEKLSVSDAFVCDFETGECGPVSIESVEEENKEENQDENNDMV